MKLLCLCCCYLNLWFNTLLFVQIPFQISKPYYLRLFIVYISMDSTDRANMVTRVNEALGIADVVDYPQTAAERIREAFVNRPRRSLAQGPSMNELIAMSLARGTAQAVESITFWCHVLILRVISGKLWYYFSCALCQCKKGVTKIGNVFMCSSCEDVCSVPIPRYKLQLEVTNGISTVMVTLFDEVAERLIKKLAHDLLSDWTIDHDPFALPSEISCLQRKFHVMELKSNTYYDHGTYESFACSAIIKPILGMKLGIVSLDAVGINTSGVQNVSDLLPKLIIGCGSEAPEIGRPVA